jgi:two-component system, NtrC family, response regulator AlgB
MVDPTLLSNSKPVIEEVSAVAGHLSTDEPPNPQDLPLGDGSQPAATQALSEPDSASGGRRQLNLGFFETHSVRMKKCLDAAYKAAFTSAPVLLTGETGVGKSVLARQIHDWGRLHEHAFVVVNCALISKRVFEDTPFDHVIAALVGSRRKRRQQADILRGSTILFDNISELCELGQARLLQFLEEQNFQLIFQQNLSWTPYRIIAAGNRSLVSEVSGKRFSKELFFRISVINLEVPPLRERLEDIPALASYLLSSVSLVTERPGLQLSPEAAGTLTQHRWPGNVRELRNTIERAAILTRGDVITSRLLSKAIGAKNATLSMALHPLTSLEEVERNHILQILSQTESLQQAAIILGINPTTLWRKRRRHNLEWRRLPSPHTSG